MRAIETAAAAVERATGQAELASAHIEVVAAADIEVRIGGEAVALDAGGYWSSSATTTDRDRGARRADRACGARAPPAADSRQNSMPRNRF